MAGWHNVWSDEGGSRWVHPKVDIRLPFVKAAAIFKKRGIDEYGEMK